MLKKVSNNYRYLGLLATVLLAIAVISIGPLKNNSSSYKAPPKTAAKEELASQEGSSSKQIKDKGQSSQAATKGNEHKLLIESEMSEFGTKVQSIKEALSQIEARPKLPSLAVAGEPKAIYVTGAPEPKLKGISFEYENGMEIWIYPNKFPAPNYNEDAKTFSRVSVTEINGFKGTVADHNNKVLQGIGEVSEVAAVVWYEDGIEYQIYGDKAGQIRLKDLLPIAKSMQ
ncbi:MAG: hypothetical protein QME41_06990 [Actinomycetota bacterium]|nr:hypothetical protein [Actinomycetota bacterium]